MNVYSPSLHFFFPPMSGNLETRSSPEENVAISAAIDVIATGEFEQHARDRIERLSLFQKFLRNIALNTPQLEEQSGVPLRVNQWKAINCFLDFLRGEGGGNNSGYFVLPTGAGKTVLFGAMAKLLQVRTLILEPRSNLLDQTRKAFINQVGISPDHIGFVGEDDSLFDRPITITTYQGHRARMENDASYRSHVQQCELIICDEAHRGLGQATQASINAISTESDLELTIEEEEAEMQVLSDLNKSSNRGALKLGFTATPKLMHKGVHEHFGRLISSETHSDLVKAGVLAKYKIIQVQGHVEPGEIGSSITEQQEAHLLGREKVYQKSLAKFVTLKNEVQERLLPIAFCCSIKECDLFRSLAKGQNITCEVLTNWQVPLS